MQVSVNKTGCEIATLTVDDLSRLVRTSSVISTIVENTDDHTILDGDATGRHALTVHIDDLCVGKQCVDGHAALGGDLLGERTGLLHRFESGRGQLDRGVVARDGDKGFKRQAVAVDHNVLDRGGIHDHGSCLFS